MSQGAVPSAHTPGASAVAQDVPLRVAGTNTARIRGVLRAVVTLRTERHRAKVAPIARPQRDGRSFGSAMKPATKREVPLHRPRSEPLRGGLGPDARDRTMVQMLVTTGGKGGDRNLAVALWPTPPLRFAGTPSRPGSAQMGALGPPIVQAVVLEPGHR